MSSSSGVLTLCLDALNVLEGPEFPAERKLDALRLLRARLPELGPKDTEQYYKVVRSMRDRLVRAGATRNVIGQRIEVEMPDPALPDPGLNWDF